MVDRNYEYQKVLSDVASVNQDQVHRMEARPEPGQLWRQYLIAAFVNIGGACTGYSMGWSSPIIGILGNVTTSPLDDVITTNQEAWIGSLLTVGAIFGPFLAGTIVSTIGRKWGLITSCLPMLIGWLLIMFTHNVAMIYAGRFFWGLSTGMFFMVIPMYCAEIATDESRGSLGSFLQLLCMLGFLMVYSIGPFTSYTVVAYVGILMVAMFCVGLFFIPESPFFFLAKNNKAAAAKCLARIRGQSINTVKSEIDKMDAEVTLSMARTASLTDIFRGSNFKAFYISCALLFFQQFSGINAVLFYMSSIFEASGASLDSSISTIIIGAVLVGASCITPLVVDRLGRRILLFISTSGTAIALGLLGVYFILSDNNNPIVASLGLLPILTLVLFILAYCAGVGPLAWAIMAELLPIEVKTTAAPIATAYCWGLSFLITRFFGPFANAIGMGSTFLVFGVCCVLGFFFTLLVVPETKGKSFQEIQDILAGKSSKASETLKKEQI